MTKNLEFPLSCPVALMYNGFEFLSVIIRTEREDATRITNHEGTSERYVHGKIIYSRQTIQLLSNLYYFNMNVQ